MKKPGKPVDEDARLQKLESLGLVYSPAEERFDRITRLAQRLFNVPIALITLVADERQWFKSAAGLALAETSREVSFCGHAILQDGTLVVPDALADADFADNPLVAGPPHVRFYAGQPLRVGGRAIGTLCLIDRRPRQFSADDVGLLQSLAEIVVSECRPVELSDVQWQVLAENRQGQRAVLIDAATQSWNSAAMQHMLPREIALSMHKKDHFSYLHLQLIPDPASIAGLPDDDIADLLRQAAQRIRRSMRPYDLVAYVGSGRFAVYAPACSSDVSELLVERIRSRIGDVPFDVGGSDHSIEVKAGIVSCEAQRDLTPERLTALADLALKDAFDSRRGYVRLVV